MNRAHFNVDTLIQPYLEGPKYTEPATIELIQKHPELKDLEGLSVSHATHIHPELLAQMPHLKVVVTRSVGTDHLDLNLLKSKGITVFNIPDYGSYNIAEFAVGLLLAGARHIVDSDKDTHNGNFSFIPFMGSSLKGKTVGVVGTGRIGIEFIKRIASFEVTIIAFDAYPNEKNAETYGFTYVSKEELWKKSDFISLHVPLMDSTRYLVNEEAISLMKKDIVLVNTARGEIIDTNALIKHIEKFKYICLDVVEGEEQFSKDHPLLAYKNVIITPHNSFVSDKVNERLFGLILENLNTSIELLF